ncbi:uncharacterized protein [Diabrotica undecimpunctata]|uniref:uncharacterized protein isoform X1 n=1 Tax=Diabrotica undecimpunctata TaxID=50387 RepID=UPI003B640E2A
MQRNISMLDTGDGPLKKPKPDVVLELVKVAVSDIYVSVDCPWDNTEVFTRDGQHRRWDRKVAEIENYLNTIPNTLSKETPEYIMKGVMPIRSWEDPKQREYQRVLETVQRRLQRSNEKYLQRQSHNRRRRPVTFQKGEKVLVRALRLMPVFEGPYIIHNENGINSYVLRHVESEKIREIYNIHDVYKYHE